jgi:nucleoside-diphosphate-sugar epimerase
VSAFVTGAAGFVGSHVVEALLARGLEVRALVRRPEAEAALAAAGARPVRGALEDAAAVRGALTGVSTVYHVAGLTSGAEADLHAVNADATRRLLALAGEVCPGARIVYVSSQAALGPSPRGTPLAEDAPCRPVSAYGRSKLAGEDAVRASPLAWTIVRPPAVYGPRDREFLRLFRIARSGLVPVFGTGAQELTLVYAGDLAEAIVAAGTSPAAAREVLHAGHPEIARSRDVARAAARALNRGAVLLPVPGVLAGPIVALIARAAAAAGRRTVVTPDKMAEFLAPAWLLDSRKADRLLGWRAATDLRTGFARTAAWYREAGWL